MLKKAIFFGAHDDDVEIGCAGTAIKLKKKNSKFIKLLLVAQVLRMSMGKLLDKMISQKKRL